MHPSHQQLLKLVKLERQTTAQILMHLKIINEQKIFVKMNYKSLVHYCVKALGYSESAAYRRVQALRLENKVDGIREKIANGDLNLSKASKLNQLIDLKEKQERKKSWRKRKVAAIGGDQNTVEHRGGGNDSETIAISTGEKNTHNRNVGRKLPKMDRI